MPQAERQDRVLGFDFGVRKDAKEGREASLRIAVDDQDLVSANA